MSQYEREQVAVGSLQDGDVFEHPMREDTICKVSHVGLHTEDGRHLRILGYSILEGALHWPAIYLPLDHPVVLLLPTTTYVKLSGKEWVDSLTEHHGVSGE